MSGHDYSGLMAELTDSFNRGRTRSAQWRESQLKAVSQMLRERETEFLGALKTDLGKHPMEAWTTELSYVTGEAAHFRKHLRRWMKPRKVRTPVFAQPAKSWVQPEPLGVVLVMSAWNYPLQLALSPLTAAIAAGNCAVVKPSELAPATSEIMAKRIPEYLDNDCIRVVEGAIPETTTLLEQAFDHIIYTGGSNVARIVMTAAARHLTPVTLELGGKSPCVVLPDANLEVAARRIAWGRFTNAGQTCIAPDYVITDADTESRLVPLLEKNIREMFGRDPSKSESYGHIINQRHFDRIAALLDSGDVAIGGETDRDSLYIAPTVLTGVDPSEPAMQQEIFGPILPVVRRDDLEAAIALIRKGDKPLAAYIFTRDRNAEARFLEQVSSGSACVNDVMMFMANPDLPFGGVGESGIGQYKGELGFMTLSHRKSVMRRGWMPDVKLRYAPYTEKAFRLLRKLR
jgi:aldehyde dehydrogenase (NAD+)